MPRPVLTHTAVGMQGKPVNTVLVATKMKLSAEKYFAIALDRKTAGPIVIACRRVHLY